MKITRFYKDVLGAALANTQWSWGAVDRVTNRVYLRVWLDEIEPHADGERVLVLRKNPLRRSAGYPERIRHLDAIRNGASGFGVVCITKNPGSAGKRSIVGFNENELLVLGQLVDEDAAVFALVDGRVAFNDLART